MTSHRIRVIENWRSVVGHPDYEVSDLGRVRSVDRVQTYERFDLPTGKAITVQRTLRGKLLRPGPTSTGHLTVSIGRGNSQLVHVLVLEAFVGPKPPKPFEGLHWDDDRTNNKLSNLRWGTRSANLHDAVRNGRKAVGERCQQAKLKNADIPAIRRRFGKASFAQIGRDYGVTESTIRQIKNNKAWRHVR